MKKLITLSILFSILALNNLAIAQDIKIGLAGPLTGPYAAFGEQMKHGAEQAIKDLGKQYKDFKFTLVTVDDSCEPKQAVMIANRLVEKENVDAIIGHFCSSSTVPASNIYADADKLMITPGSTNPLITERKLASIMRMCGRDDQQGVVAANFISQVLKSKRVAVVHDNDTYGKGISDAMRARLKQLGKSTVMYEGLTRGEKDFNAIVTKLRQVKADVIYFGGLHPEAGPLVRQMREQGVMIPFIAGDGIMSKDFVSSAGGPKMVKNVFMTFGRDPRSIEKGKALVNKFRKNGYEPEGYTLYSYATVEVILEAINRTKSTQGSVLSQWLKRNKVQTIMGDKAWDHKGDLKDADYIMYAWGDDGEYHALNNNPLIPKAKIQ